MNLLWPLNAVQALPSARSNLPFLGTKFAWRLDATFLLERTRNIHMEPMRNSLRQFVRGIPFVGSAARKVARLPIVTRARGLAFRDSASYWESRYREGGTSGAGS